MPEVTYRPMTASDADIEAVVALLVAAEAADRTEEHYDADDLREELANPLTDPATDWVLAVRDGEVVAHQRIIPRSAQDGVQRIFLDGAVHPGHRGRGLASDLLPRMVTRAREYAAARGVRPVLTATAPDDLAEAAEVLVAHGLRPDRYTFVMEADLRDGTAEPPGVPAGLSLHTWEGLDPEEIRAAHNIAFVGHPGFAAWDAEMWQQWVTGSRHDRPSLSLLLRDADGAIASYVHTQEYAADEAATGVRETFVGKVGTLPQHRRRGLAGLLLRHALRRYAEAGYAATSLDVDSENPSGANSVYEQAGFRVTRRWTNFEWRG